MAFSLAQYARQYVIDPGALRKTLSAPLLVWEAPTEVDESEELLFGTTSGAGLKRPTSNDPLVYEVKKGQAKNNAFLMGITVGRTENNDIAIEDNSVSRFHAYFRQDAGGNWTLVDAESRNGTIADGFKLTGSAGHLVKPGSKLRFGGVDLVFHSPATFLDYLKLKVDGKPGR